MGGWACKKVQNVGGVFLQKSGKCGVVKKWTFSQSRVHYVQYQYFYFTFYLFGGAYAPNAPRCLRAYDLSLVSSIFSNRAAVSIVKRTADKNATPERPLNTKAPTFYCFYGCKSFPFLSLPLRRSFRCAAACSGVASTGPGRTLARPLIHQLEPGSA